MPTRTILPPRRQADYPRPAYRTQRAINGDVTKRCPTCANRDIAANTRECFFCAYDRREGR
jgi:hypothetical protein